MHKAFNALLVLLSLYLLSGETKSQILAEYLNNFSKNIILQCDSEKNKNIVQENSNVVGEYVFQEFSSPSPYLGKESMDVSHELVWTETIHSSDASYISPYFSQYDIKPEDFFVLRSPDHTRSWTYDFEELASFNGKGFWGIPIHGDTAIVELYAGTKQGSGGITIGKFAKGFPKDIEKTQFRSICGTDDSEEAVCYQSTEPTVYEKSLAVVRLNIGGVIACTGWLVGNEGHVITNEHCISVQAAAEVTSIEFLAEGAECSDDCTYPFGCPGIIEAASSQVVKMNADLDYVLLKPNNPINDLPSTYGYLQMRETGAEINEQIYIPQHPRAWGKRIAYFSTDTASGLGEVHSLNMPPCSLVGSDVGYLLDTQGGSSGSPVISYDDHKVVALHHCGICPNRGVPIESIIDDLGDDLPNSALCDSPEPPLNLAAQQKNDNEIQLTWSHGVGADSYDIYRSVGMCTHQSLDYQLIASKVVGTSFIDTTVSGNTTYSYKLKSHNQTVQCDSLFTECSYATATGLCTMAPTFDGLETISSSQSPICKTSLQWSQADQNCGTNISYNIYRDTVDDFQPSVQNLISACVDGLSFNDFDLQSDATYYYSVQAEDNSGNGSGLCGFGNENTSLTQSGIRPMGPNSVVFFDEVPSSQPNDAWIAVNGSGDDGSTHNWSITDSRSFSPPYSWFIQEYSGNKEKLLIYNNSLSVNNEFYMLEFNQFMGLERLKSGAVLEYSTDNGATWYDILRGNGVTVPDNSSRIEQTGYNENPLIGDGVLAGRLAWTGNTYDGWQNVKVSLADFDGTDIKLRWRYGSDSSGNNYGWYVDDVKIYSTSSCINIADDLIFINGFGEV